MIEFNLPLPEELYVYHAAFRGQPAGTKAIFTGFAVRYDTTSPSYPAFMDVCNSIVFGFTDVERNGDSEAISAAQMHPRGKTVTPGNLVEAGSRLAAIGTTFSQASVDINQGIFAVSGALCAIYDPVTNTYGLSVELDAVGDNHGATFEKLTLTMPLAGTVGKRLKFGFLTGAYIDPNEFTPFGLSGEVPVSVTAEGGGALRMILASYVDILGGEAKFSPDTAVAYTDASIANGEFVMTPSLYAALVAEGMEDLVFDVWLPTGYTPNARIFAGFNQ